MFTEIFPAEVFRLQREFIKAMNAKRDFVWWAEKLIVEETKELDEALHKKEISDENFHHIFKEIGDLIYVVAGFYNTMPVFAPELLSDSRNEKIKQILQTAYHTLYEAVSKLEIPHPIMIRCFELVHESNMSKLDDNGKPLRRDDGKILKGPNYKAPDMTDAVESWKKNQRNRNQTNESQSTH